MRVETGPFRPSPDDWQGYFIRGDNALGLANDLVMMAVALRRGHVDQDTLTDLLEPFAQRLERLAAQLETCREA